MSFFFIGYYILFYLDIIQFIISNKLYKNRFNNFESEIAIINFYILQLEFQGYFNIAKLYYKKDISSVISFVLIRIELFTVICYVYLSKSFFKPIYFTISTNIIMILFLSFYWMEIYNLILRSYSHKIGSDVEIKNIFIIRSLYHSMKDQSYMLFIFIFLLTLYSNRLNDYKLAYIFMSIPVFLIKVLEREEEINEDKIAKFIVISLLLSLASTFLVFSIIFPTIENSKYFRLLFILNSYHFLLAGLLSITDFYNYKKGLKEALDKNKIKKQLKLSKR